MFTLAHLSDIHLGPLPRPGLRQLMNKRMLGYANWQFGRKSLHRHEILDALITDLKFRESDHIAITGDLVNIGLPREFELARDWLHALGKPDGITLVPGNHDAYVKLDHVSSIGLWHEYMSADTGHELDHVCNATGFPFVRIRGPVALIGLSTAVPTRPFTAAGELDKPQLDALPPLLNALQERQLFRVVLIHHPPLQGLTSRARGLRNARELVRILKTHGAELVLYGHNHKQILDYLETATGTLPVVGVPSASAARQGHKPLARYNLFEISGAAPQWRCKMTGRGLLEPDGAITEIEKTTLLGNQPT